MPIPITIAKGLTSSDAAAPRALVSAWDVAIAGLAADPDVLQHAFSAKYRAGLAPINRVSGRVFSVVNSGSGAMAIEANDSVFGHDSLDFSLGAASSVRPALGGIAPPSSYTMGMVFVPTTTGDTGEAIFGMGPTPFGGRVVLDATNFRATPQLGSGELSLAARSVIDETGPNVCVVSFDAATRTIAGWVNSLTNALVTGGPSPWPTLTTSNNISFGAGGATTSDGADIRIAGGFFCTGALHVTGRGIRRAKRLVQAAAETYAITLV